MTIEANMAASAGAMDRETASRAAGSIEQRAARPQGEKCREMKRRKKSERRGGLEAGRLHYVQTPE